MKPFFTGLLYQTLIHSALPVVAAISWRKCSKARKQQPKLSSCFSEKFGILPAGYQQNGILIHAVSLGETLSVLPLIKQLQLEYPSLTITLTNGSIRGAKQLIDKLPAGIQHSFLPLDYPFTLNRFLETLQPKLVVIIETEIWPNLLKACHQKNIPIILANARLKQNSMENYRKFGGKWLQARLNLLTAIACQFETDRQHFEQLGVQAEKLTCMGNLKFDLEISDAQKTAAQTWRNHNLSGRFCWVAASTHEHEEALMLQAHKALLATSPSSLLILVPRQADRFKEVETLLIEQNWHYQKRSELPKPLNLEQSNLQPQTQVLLADSVGEMMHWMGVCNAAFIGGSMVNFGGHNILEPAAWQKPVLSGPHYQNLKALYQVFLDANCIDICQTPQELSQNLVNLLENPNITELKGLKAFETFKSQTGAQAKLFELIHPYLAQ